jgi:uncharacterized protein YcfJ
MITREIKMKNKLIVSLLCLLASHSSFAGITFEFSTKESVPVQVPVMNEFSDNARVLMIEKVYSDYVIRESTQECYVTQSYQTTNSNGDLSTNAFLSGVVGGMIGNKIGNEDTKGALSLIGFLVGVGAAQNQEAASNSTQLVSRQVCENMYPTSFVSGAMFYRITYVYQEQLFSYISKAKHYTDIIQVKVSVAPIDDYIVGMN